MFFDIDSDWNNGINIMVLLKKKVVGNLNSYCFHCYNTFSVTDNKKWCITVIKLFSFDQPLSHRSSTALFFSLVIHAVSDDDWLRVKFHGKPTRGRRGCVYTLLCTHSHKQQ